MGEISTEVNKGGAVASPGATMDSGGLLAQIVAAASNPDVDAAKMETMANLAMRLQGHEQQQQFNRDMNAAIMAMPVITKDGRIVIKDNNGNVRQSTPFAKFEDIDRVVRPICAAHNLSYSFEVGGDAQRITVRPIIRHVNGHVERGEALPLPIEGSGSKNPVQGTGSSVTYGKRYCLCAAFSIVTEGLDVDGHGNELIQHLPHEREATVLAEGTAAQAAGTYAEWYRAQSPRDRLWLVQTGRHAEFGGQALTDQSGGNSPAKGGGPTRDDTPARPTGPRKVDGSNAKEWTDNYVALVKAAKDSAELAQTKELNAKGRTRVEDTDSKQWDRIVDAELIASDSFAGDE